MEQTIASYLFFNKECLLPSIGILKLVTHPAENDFLHSEIKAPVQSITFSTVHANIASTSLQELFNISNQLKETLDQNGSVSLKGIGTFSKDDAGHIQFSPVQLNPAFTPAVKTEAIQQKAEAPKKKAIKKEEPAKEIPVAAITPKEEETIAPVETIATETDIETILPEEKSRNRWQLWAAALVLISLVSIIIYFSSNNANATASFGNASTIQPSASDSTYHTVK